jgi:hypothetical protein
MASPDTELWTVQTEDGRVFRCVVRFAPGGVEAVIIENGTVVAGHLFSSGTEAYAWAEDAREQLLEAS